MARFYDTSRTNFIDYDLSATSRPPKGESIDTIFGSLNAIAEDRPRLDEIIRGYESRVDDLARQLQVNPNALSSLNPDIRSLKSDLNRDMQAGELRAIQDRFDRYTDTSSRIDEVFKNQPGLADAARSLIQIEGLNFDPTTGGYGRITSPDVVTPFTTSDLGTWLKNQEAIINEDFISRIQDEENLDRYTKLFERGELRGVLKEDVVRQLASAVTPEMIASAQQERSLRGDTSVQEGEFFTDGALNLNTTYGRLIDATADNIARTIRDSRFIKDSDEGRIAFTREAAKTKGAARRRADEGKWLADKMVAMRDGNPEVMGEIGDSLKGRETEDGGIVERITPSGNGNEAMVIVSYEEPILNDEEVLDEDGNPTGETRRVPVQIVDEDGELVTATQRVSYPKPMNMATLETIYGQKEMTRLREALIQMDEYDEGRADIKNRERKRTPLSE